MSCYNPYEYVRQQGMNTMDMQNMGGFQMPMGGQQQGQFGQTPMGAQQGQFGQMPIMPMMPMQPMGQMGQMGQMMPIADPTGTTSGSMPTTIGSMPLQTLAEDPVMDTEYTQGWLRTQIGKRVKIEFLIGTNMLVDREGTLVDVGISYVIINEVETDDLLLCDIYSIKFVRVYF